MKLPEPYYTAKELAGKPGMPGTVQNVNSKAKRENWPWRKHAGKGGGREYPLSSLPAETRAALAVASTTSASLSTRPLSNQTPAPADGSTPLTDRSLSEAEGAALVTMGINPLHPETQKMIRAGRAARKQKDLDDDARRRMKELSLARFNQLPEEKQRSGNAHYEIIKSAKTYCVAAGVHPGNEQWLKRFASAYNDGSLSLPEWVRDEIPRISTSSLYRWRREYDAGGMFELADGYVSKKGQTSLTTDQQELAIAMQIQFPGCAIKKVVAALEARRMPAPHGQVKRFVQRWLAMNQSFHLYMTNPDEWKNKNMFAFGNASEQVERLNQVWEADSTPGDIMLSDGRFAVIGALDVYSRRLRLLVTPTSKATAISALLRRCILEWGVMETLKTDNGQDYVAHHIERLLASLEVEHVLCPPFTPEAKPHIERALGVFSHGIVELLPGYIGHSVADRKAIEARKSFADRLMKRGGEVEVKLTSLEFQKTCDRWVDAMYMHDAHGGLDGKTPAEMVREWTTPIRQIADVRALDVLLHPAHKDGGYRIIGKEGVRLDNRDYIAPEFAGRERERVRVLVDDTDLGHAYIYAEDGSFICCAENPEWQGISGADMASYCKARQKALNVEQRKEQIRKNKELKVETVPEDILNYREERIATIVEFPKQSVPYVTPALAEAAKAALERDARAADRAAQGLPVEHRELPPEVLEYEARQEEAEKQKVISLENKRKFKEVQCQADVYYEIRARIKDGTATEYQKQWKKDFEYWENSGGKIVGLMKEDPYCLKDPEENKQKQKEG
jgi:hypothetical protein